MKKKLYFLGVIAALPLLALHSPHCMAMTGGKTQTVSLMAVSEGEDAVRLTGNTYSVSGTDINLNVSADSDITESLDDALREARDLATAEAPVTVTVPAGSYKTSGNLHIYSNTKLVLTGVTLTYVGKESHNMLMTGTVGAYKDVKNYNESSLCSGYNGFENITIIGGTFLSSDSNESTVIRMAHGKNFLLEGVKIKGGGCEHQMEVAAIDGFYVRNCTFEDFGKSGKNAENRDKQEALQLDIPCSSDVFTAVYEDGTMMKNVEVTGCTFRDVPRGVGTHTLLNGAYFENVKINNNTFTNVLEEAIICLNYQNCEIKNNTITDCGAGVLFQYFKADTDSVYTTVFDGTTPYEGNIIHDAKTVITENNIKTKYAPTCSETQGIRVYGTVLPGRSDGADGRKVPAGDYYVSNVTVTNNRIITAGHGIHMSDARDCVVSGNSIAGKGVASSDVMKEKYDGIFVEQWSKNVAVTGNTIGNMVRNGIFVQVNSTVSEVTDNVITGCDAKGINFYDKSGSTGDIQNNVIENCKESGILVSTGSKVKNITNNTMTDLLASNANGIAIYKNSKVNGTISNNSITNTGDSAIAVSTKSTVTGSIEANTIKSSKKSGVFVYNSGKVNGNITGNKISNVTENGIGITTKCTIGGNISKNKIKTAKKSGIFVYKSSRVNKNISKNTISRVNMNGIYITGTTVVKGTVDGNKVTTAKGKGIYVYDKKGKTTVKAIKNNTITGTNSQGINLTSTKNNIIISGNKLSKIKDNVIIIQTGTTKYKVTIKNNTVSGTGKSNGIRGISGKMTVSGNKISNVVYGIYTEKKVKATIGKNTFGKKVKNKMKIAGKVTK